MTRIEAKSRLQRESKDAHGRSVMDGRYKPIEDYGVIGNLHTVALVGMDGSIDWCCLPHFDSPSVFAALLDARRGGSFRISPPNECKRRQFYLPDSNILCTRFHDEAGVGEIIDFMPIDVDPHQEPTAHHIYRIVRVMRGRVKFRMECRPAFHYGLHAHRVRLGAEAAVFESEGMGLTLRSSVPVRKEDGGVRAEFTLGQGESASFILSHLEKNARGGSTPAPWRSAFDETLDYWQRWTARMQYHGRWREMVTRSALALKLLTFAPTGAIVAAPTTSLPEEIGGLRNWDYRYTWIRDASFTLYALLRLGYSDEAGAFMGWIQNRLGELGPDASLNIMYGLHGEHRLTERTLKHFEGYRGSTPVRVGNAAYDQLQLDIYGELMDSVYLYDKYGAPVSYDLWANLRKLLGHVCAVWNKKDRGIWEVRNERRHFVYSKVMCWVALDRGLRLARKRSLPADWALWSKTRDRIYEEVMHKGWNARINSFVQYYGTNAVDASALIMPLVKFISPRDPRMLGTLDQIGRRLTSDSLVHRYQIGEGLGDGLSGGEGTFSMCTFWYAEVLARAGRVAEARWVFEKMLGYANHLGLYAEEIGANGQQLGNFPQAFTHLALISAAYNLDRILASEDGAASAETFRFFNDPDMTHRRDAEPTSKPPNRRRRS